MGTGNGFARRVDLAGRLGKALAGWRWALALAVAGGAFAASAAAEPLVAADVESCDQIRARIGSAPLAEPSLLRKLGARQDCRFTAAEVYRAAYGDRPLPPPEPPRRDGRHDADDD